MGNHVAYKCTKKRSSGVDVFSVGDVENVTLINEV